MLAGPGVLVAGDPIAARIAALKADRARLSAERRQVQKELKVSEQKRQRLMQRARNLSNEDLAAVLGARVAAAAAKAAEPDAKGKGKGKGKGKDNGKGGGK